MHTPMCVCVCVIICNCCYRNQFHLARFYSTALAVECPLYILGALLALLRDAAGPGLGDIRASMARGLNANVNYLTTEPLKVNVSTCRAYSRGRAGLSEKRPDIYRRHNAAIKWYVGTNFWACTYGCSYAAAMRRQLGARFHKCLKSDKPQKVLIKNLPLDFQNVRAGRRGGGSGVMQSLSAQRREVSGCCPCLTHAKS